MSWAGLEKPGHSGFQTEGSVLGCLAAFSYLGEMLTSGTSEVPRSSSSMTGQAWDRYDQCCTSLGPERGSVLFSDPNLAAGEGAKVLALCSGVCTGAKGKAEILFFLNYSIIDIQYYEGCT